MRGFALAASIMLLLPLPACQLHDSPAGAAAGQPPAPSGWRVDAGSDYFDYLSLETRRLVDTDPHAVARQVCADLGGRLQLLTHRGSPLTPNDVTCLFEQPGMRESVRVGRLLHQ